MAARDIMPWKSPLGGTYEVRWAAMTAGETFEVGEVVGIVDAGTLSEMPADTTELLIADTDGGLGGIAAYGPGAGNIDPDTGAAMATGAMVPYWPWNQGTLFITSNFKSDAAAAVVVPALTDIGESYEISYSNATVPLGWGIDQTNAAVATEVCARIVDVLDAGYVSINEPHSDGTGVYLVFEITLQV